MDNFQNKFVMEFFMDNDSVCAMNRMAVAVADVINENDDNLCSYINLINDEFGEDPEIESSNRNTHVPVTYTDYYEKEIQYFSSEEYEAMFGMKRSTIQALSDFLTGIEKPGVIPLLKKVHVFVMFLMTDGSYNDVGKFFGLHKSTVGYIFHEIATYLAENRHAYISWPSVEEQHITRLKVNTRFKIPNCVGFINACRLKFGPKRKKHDTVLLQAVCDESLMFIDIHIGEVGKTKKNKVFKESLLAQELKNFVEYDNHILGDSEYKLQMNLITPFTSEELLTSEEMRFNDVHWKARCYIQTAFEQLKSKMCKLNHLDIFKPEFVHTVIYSACVLHNFILMHEGNPEVKQENIMCDDGVVMNTEIVQTSVEKRQFLCNYVNYIDSDSDSISR